MAKKEIVSGGASNTETIQDIKGLYCDILSISIADNLIKTTRKKGTAQDEILELIIKALNKKSLHNDQVLLVLSGLDDNLISLKSDEIKIVVTPHKKITYESNPMKLSASRIYTLESSADQIDLKSKNKENTFEHTNDEINNFLQHVKTILIYLKDEISQDRQEKIKRKNNTISIK